MPTKSRTGNPELDALVTEATRKANREAKAARGLGRKAASAAYRGARKGTVGIGRKVVSTIDAHRELSGEDATDDTCENIVGWTVGGLIVWFLIQLRG